MANPNFTSQNVPRTTETNSQSVKTSQTLMMDHYLPNIATDKSIVLGSFYNALTDRTFGKLSLGGTPIIKIPSKKPVHCTITKNNNIFVPTNLFYTTGLYEEIHLNWALNAVSAQGMSLMLNYLFPKSLNTRFLYYYYRSRLEWISHQQYRVTQNIPKDIPDIAATHIISDIKLGIQVFIVLEVTSIDETSFDDLLAQTRSQLIMNKFELTETQKRLLNQIKLTKIFSNIPDLLTMETLDDFCQKIIEIKSNTHCHLPLEYALRPIKWFYSSYPEEKAKYIPLEQKTIETIRQYLLSLSSTIQKLKLLCNSKLVKSSREYLNQHFDEVQHYKKIQEMHPDEIERIRDLVLKIRNGTLQQNGINHFLTNEHRKSLEQHINAASDTIICLREDKKLVSDLKEPNVNNWNSKDVSIRRTNDSNTLLQKHIEYINQSIDSRRDNDERKLNSSTCNHLNEDIAHNTHDVDSMDFSNNSINLSDEKTLALKPSDNIEEKFEPINLPASSTLEALLANEQSKIIRQTLNQRKTSIVPMNDGTLSSEMQLPYVKTTINVAPKFAEQIEEHSNNFDNQLNSSLTKQLNDIKEKNNIPTIKPVSQTIQQPKNLEAPFNSPKLSNSEDTFLSKKQSNNVKEKNQILKSSKESDSEDLSNIDYTNILLLGESGVGKSTFINALVNYLQFKTFQQAHNEKPLVVIPVSFIMTIDDNFQEKIMKYGDLDSNEDHNNIGQSVTQYCKSYLFKINNKTILRIIDTPGMGDTRGFDQDDLNIKNILSFINNLSHLNAICILLKPNESRLNIVLRSYFTRLINFIGQNAQNNIIFCFTNTRTTFFTPGNTGPLLKQMINKLQIKGIPFKKTNTFCFDNESFRYLIARKNGIDFDEYLKQEYDKSWITSVKESNRFLEFILNGIKPYSQSEWKSIEHAQFKINRIIRPLLETMRNILRNIISLEQNSSKYVINLYPTYISQSSYICYECQRTPKRYSDFWILPDDLHSFSEKCQNCNCPQQKHIQVDYKLDYEISQYESTPSFAHMRSKLEQLQEVILKFDEFYAYVVDILKQNDPMLAALNRMIIEENQICREKGSECLNNKLYEMLAEFTKEYEKKQKTSILSKKPIDLPNIYEEIKKLNEIDEIDRQMDVIKQSQEKYMKQNEKQVL